MNEEWLSAHLDGELSASEDAEVEAALVADPELAATYDDLARVRALLRAGSVDLPAASFERILAAVDGTYADETDGGGVDRVRRARVTAIAPRRRVPTAAAVAAALVIIASVVGGIGGPESLPALGDLIAEHEAAAAVVEGQSVPPGGDEVGDEMPMEEAMDVALSMPADYSMEHAMVHGATVHLMYMSGDGEPVSVFRHEGETDLDHLGAGSLSRSDEGDMWSAQRRDSSVAVVDGTGYVWVVISDEPHDAMIADMMHDLPTRSLSLAERLRETADAAVEPFRFWS